MVLPPVCVPRASGAWKSATAAPEPEEEPPGVRNLEEGEAVCGFIVLGPATVAANSVVVVLPGRVSRWVWEGRGEGRYRGGGRRRRGGR